MEQRDMKSVFMLDRSAKFVDNCNETFDFTIREGPKQKKLQIEKTIWTWCLEGIFEMHRILSDVYPSGSVQLRFALADFMGKMLDTQWRDTLITREELAKLIETVSRPTDANSDITPIGGLTMAIEALAVETPEQREFNYDARYNMSKRTARNSEVVRVTKELKSLPSQPTVQNNGNLIIYTRLKTEEEMDKLLQEIVTLVISRNKIASAPSNKTFCPITSLRLFVVNYYAAGEDCSVKTRPMGEHPELPLLKIWVISRKAADMCDAIHSLLVAAFDLGSTTVTKIPMKEDNRGSSNYDVELFHSGKVHEMLKQQKLIDTISKNGDADKGVTYDSMRLTWTTAPKSKWSLFPYHGEAVPCTTAQAYSRPSACLTQFVRDGRCVMLDSEKTTELGMNTPDKLVSHLLIANRGRIFIQEVDFMQKSALNERFVGILKQPTALSEPDDHINLNQLKHAYKQMELRFIAKNRMNDKMTDEDKKKWKMLKHADIKKRFLCISKNIPLYAADTFIFNEDVLAKLEPLVTMITKATLTQSNVEQCNAVTMKLYQMRAQKEFIVPDDSDIGPCSVEDLSDPEEQMRVTIVELAKHMMKFAKYSDRHMEVYKTFMTTMGVDNLLNVDLDDDKAVEKMFVTFPFFGRADKESGSDEDSEGSDDYDEEDDEDLSDSEHSCADVDANDNLGDVNASLNKWFNSVEERAEKKRKEMYGLVKIKKIEEVTEKPIVLAEEIKLNIFEKMCDMLELKESKIRREFVGRETHGNKALLYPLLAEKLDRPASPSTAGERSERNEGIERTEKSARAERMERTERIRNAERGGSGTPPPIRRQYN